MQQGSPCLLGIVIFRNISDEADHNPVLDKDQKKFAIQLPSWEAYDSLVSKELPITHIKTLPVYAAPAHEWLTVLTVLKISQNITTQVIGPAWRTVVMLMDYTNLLGNFKCYNMI